tara:strand:- start:2001 stop:2270 length:270 start_codon:yes stop_codon:yes gene_type:complete
MIKRVIKMSEEQSVIDNLADLESFLLNVESGGFGLKGVAGVGMATNNKDGSRFVAVFDDNQKLLLARMITENVFQTGQDMVRNGVGRKH